MPLKSGKQSAFSAVVKNDILREYLILTVLDIYNLFAQLQMFTAPKTMNNIPATLFIMASPPFVSFFLKTLVRPVRNENHKRDPKKTPATSIKRETRSAAVWQILVLEKTAPKPNMDIGLVRARRNIGTNALRYFFD